MNSCVLMVEIVTEPQLRYTPEQKQVAEMGVQFAAQRSEDPPQKLKVVAWGNLAQEVQEKYQVGDRIIIEGRIQIQTRQLQDGTKQKYAELIAQKVHNLGKIAAAIAPAKPPTASTPAAPPPAKPATTTTKTRSPGNQTPTTQTAPKTRTSETAQATTSTAVDDDDTIPF